MMRSYFRGEIYFAALGQGIGSEHSGTRPVVIVQNDFGNRFSPTMIIAPISKQMETKANLPTHFCVGVIDGLTYPSMVLLEQLRVIDKTRLRGRLGRLTQKQLHKLDEALRISIGLC